VLFRSGRGIHPDGNKYTAGSILDQLEGDIERIQEALEKLTGEVKENE
jgi:hypothetical protein